MFRKKIIFKETFFIFRENFYIQGKFWYSVKKCILSENREFKFQTGWDSRISVLDIFDIKKNKLKEWLKVNWPDSTMLVSNKRPSRRSTGIFFEELTEAATGGVL